LGLVIFVLPYQNLCQKPLEIRNTLQIQRHFSSFFFVFPRFFLILRTNAHAHTPKTPKTSNKTVKTDRFLINHLYTWRNPSKMRESRLGKQYGDGYILRIKVPWAGRCNAAATTQGLIPYLLGIGMPGDLAIELGVECDVARISNGF
jgi:hypothetical protein